MPPGSRAGPAAAALVLALGYPAGSARAQTADAFEACAGQLRANPGDLEGFRCYWKVASARNLRPEAIREIEAYLAREPSNAGAKYILGTLEMDLGNPRAESLLLEAADGFLEQGNRILEGHVRLNLFFLLRRQGKTEEADVQLERAWLAARDSDDAMLRARTLSWRASRAMDRSDFGHALALLREAESLAFPDGSHHLRSQILSARGRACWALGLYRQGIDVYRREIEILDEFGDPYEAAGPRYNIALLAGRLRAAGQMDRHEQLRLVDEALDAAVRAGHLPLEARCRLLRGERIDAAYAVEELERALAIAERIADRQVADQTRRALAQNLWRHRAERRAEALRRVEETIEEGRSFGDLQEVARGEAVRAQMLWETGDRRRGIDAYLGALAAIESIRDLQPEGTVRARVFSPWAFAYDRFSGRLLRGLGDSPDPERDLDLAFRVTERMRSRVLLEEMDVAEAGGGSAGHPASRARRDEVLAEIAAIQRRLADASLPPEQRAADLAGLDRLEEEEQVLRDALAREDPEFASLRSSASPSLAQVRSALHPDEILLSFQLSSAEPCPDCWTDEGGSWLIAVNARDAFALPLPDEGTLDKQVAVFLGMLRRRDGTDERPAARLYGDLLEQALERSGPGARRLIVIPDGPLHHLPFAALRAERGGPPLVARYEVAMAPSAKLWHRWRTGAVGSAPPPRVLALADPLLGNGGAGEGEERAADPWLEGLRLGSLPYARREASTLVRRVGRGSRLLAGPEASEHSLKKADLNRYGVLHLAAHAVVDHAQPARSAVLLAPGSEEEDGFLQPREIVDLDLEGRVVLLSGCRSASGAVLEGEGMLGLARSFFQGGARAVVGSLWPLRDDEAEAVVRSFSRELARGGNVSASLAAAQAGRAGAGIPTDAWAGLVVLGDGSARPIPDGGFTVWNVVIPSIALLSIILVVRVLRRRIAL